MRFATVVLVSVGLAGFATPAFAQAGWTASARGSACVLKSPELSYIRDSDGAQAQVTGGAGARVLELLVLADGGRQLKELRAPGSPRWTARGAQSGPDVAVASIQPATLRFRNAARVKIPLDDALIAQIGKSNMVALFRDAGSGPSAIDGVRLPGFVQGIQALDACEAGLRTPNRAPALIGGAGAWLVPVANSFTPQSAGARDFVADLAIDAGGRVTSCTVRQSVGLGANDILLCKAVTARASFTPATDANGAPVPSTYRLTQRITF